MIPRSPSPSIHHGTPNHPFPLYSLSLRDNSSSNPLGSRPQACDGFKSPLLRFRIPSLKIPGQFICNKVLPIQLGRHVCSASTRLPTSIRNLATQIWTFNAEVEDQWIQNYTSRNAGAENATLVAPFPLHSDTQPDPNEEPVEFTLTPELRTFLSTFSPENPGPITMLNLLKFHDGMFPQYQKYMAGFQELLAPKYDISLRLAGPVLNEEENRGMVFDMTGWVRYNGGAASFGRMLEDEAYKELDRKFKKGVVRDNAILLIVDLEE